MTTPDTRAQERANQTRAGGALARLWWGTAFSMITISTERTRADAIGEA